MPVGTPVQPNFEIQNATVYKSAIDNAIAVASRAGFAFAVHESGPAAMSVTVAAGALFAAGAVTEVAEQLIDGIEAPDTHPRIDFVVVDTTTGVASLVEGDEAAEPVPPAVPAGKLPLALLALATDTTAISNQDIEDRRVGAGGGGGGLNPGPPSELTIDGGAVTVTGGYHTLDTEADTGNPDGVAADNLDTIDASALGEGSWLVLAAENAARVVTIRSGEDNITLTAGNFVLDTAAKRIVLQKAGGGALVEVARSHHDRDGLVAIGAPVVASGDASVEFTGLPIDDYIGFRVVFAGVRPATDAANFECRLRLEGGAFQTGGSDYSYAFQRIREDGNVAVTPDNADDGIWLAASLGNAADESGGGGVELYNAASSTLATLIYQQMMSINSPGQFQAAYGGGRLLSSAARVDGILFQMTTGNIAAGTFQLFGIKAGA